jgi:retron-type reverse transcriptase
MPNKSPTINEVFDKKNIERAWRWIKSNPDPRYKGYFRELYSDYALIENYVIDDLSNRIQKNTYEPSHGCKIFIPKSSGVLRPYTLLTIEDQIIYQSIVNVIAEHLIAAPNVKSNYYVKNFGNLYAGKKSVWFYRKWSDGYRKFNDAARESFKQGLVYTASFDLTACYDSIDHNVLAYFLQEIKCDKDFINFLKTCLTKWTGNKSSQIYHNHGIPQGPLSSGILAEVALKYFDIKYGNPPKMRYMRYVDDIRLFANSEKDLRAMLVQFDRLSKNIGLFPQSSKIEIHEIKDIEEELKSVSNPTESAIKWKVSNQKKLQKRLFALTKGYKINNQTRFKYVLAHATPSSKLNARLWRILLDYPANFEAILRYFQRYKFLPNSIIDLIISEINSQPVYSTITAALFETLDGRLRPDKQIVVNRLFKKTWHPKVLASEVALHVSVGRTIVRENLLNTPRQMKFALNTEEWYVRSRLIQSLDNDNIAPNFLTKLVNEKIRDESNDAACSAAVVLFRRGIKLSGIKKTINSRAAYILKESGIINQMPKGTKWCPVEIHLNKWLDNKVMGINWKNVFNVKYSQACTLALNCRKEANINITAWVQYVDVFNDLLLDALFQHDQSIGTHILGNIGGSLANNKFAKKYPALFSMANSIHEKRLESNLSHSFTKKTGRPTGPIPHTYYRNEGKPFIISGLLELKSKW